MNKILTPDQLIALLVNKNCSYFVSSSKEILNFQVIQYILTEIKDINAFNQLIDIEKNQYNLNDSVFTINPKYYNNEPLYKIRRKSSKLYSDEWAIELLTNQEMKLVNNVIDCCEITKFTRIVPSIMCFQEYKKGCLKDHIKFKDIPKEYLIKFLWFYEQCLHFFNSQDLSLYENFLNSKNKNSRYLSECYIINTLYIRKFNNDHEKIKLQIKNELGLDFQNIDQLIDDIWAKELKLTVEYINNKINELKNAINC